MEQRRTTNITPLKKKRRKITSTAAIILCILCFFIGILCGNSFSSGKQAEEAKRQIAALENDTEYKLSQKDAEIAAYEEKINQLKEELVETKKQLPEVPAAEVPSAEPATVDDGDVASESQEEDAPAKTSGGVLGKLIVGALIVVIVAGILFAASFLLRKNEDGEEYDDEEYEEDEEYDEDEEEEYEEEDDEDIIDEEE